MSDIDVHQGWTGLCVNSVEHPPCSLPPVAWFTDSTNRYLDSDQPASWYPHQNKKTTGL